jgi:hypothetical protein
MELEQIKKWILAVIIQDLGTQVVVEVIRILVHPSEICHNKNLLTT